MNRNSNLSPLPFYQSIDEQSFRMSYAYGEVYPLIAPKNRFLPFQIVTKEVGGLSNVIVTLCNYDGSVTMDISTAMVQAGLTVLDYPEDGYRIISFPAIVDKDIWNEFGLDFNNDFSMADFPVTESGQPTPTGEGRAYLMVEFGGKTWYSDVMTLVSDLSGCLKVEWYSYKDIEYKGGRIAYEDNVYSNIMYVMREIGKPSYDFSDDGEDRNGYYYATKQVSEKTYHFTFLATEPICDMLRTISLSDVILVTDQYGRQYQCDTFLPTPTWQGSGYLASVDCEFQTDTMVVQTMRIIDQESMKPQFFIDRHVRTTYQAASAGSAVVLYIVPSLAGLEVSTTASWITITHLYDNAYKLTFAPTSTTREAYINATSDYSSASLKIVQSQG